MRYRGAQICRWTHGSCCFSRHSLSGSLYGRMTLVRSYSGPHQPGSPLPAPAPPPGGKSGGEVVKERALAALQHAGELGQQWGRRSSQAATATINYWWERYEEFVGINEVRVAQTNVTEAEAAFMVSRGMVREAHAGLEALQVRLKEVRDRLDRVSREEAHYLELATLEHKLLQEERRHRTAYENGESSEREKFALFSAAVRASHEKERTRAERTKNWSVIGSVLGALIGVMGSTYINRVRLQELKNLLLEAQKGPESLQEALRVQAGNHRSQRDELQTIIDGLRVALGDASAARLVVAPASAASPPSAFADLQSSSQRTNTLLESLEQGLGRVEGKLSAVKRQLHATTPPAGELHSDQGPERGGELWAESEAAVAAVRRLEETQRTLGERMRTNAVFSGVFAYTAAAVTVSAVYVMLRGGA